MKTTSPTLEWLRAWLHTDRVAGLDVHEYRLLLSGCAYNGDLQGDPLRSDGGRVLTEEPSLIWCVSRPLDSYPQELALWVQVAARTLEGTSEVFATVSTTRVPHDEVVADIAALLTLYLRRLVSVVGEIGVSFPEEERPAFAPSPYPMPIVGESATAIVWPRLPLTVIYGGEDVSYDNPNPGVVPVSPPTVKSFFSRIADHPEAQVVINAAKIYHRAMELIFSHSDVSYLLFVCAAESAAQQVFKQNFTIEDLWTEPETKKLAERAECHGLSKAAAQELAMIAAELLDKKGATKKFVDFLMNYGAGHTNTPPLLNAKVLELAKVSDEESALRKAYGARSNFVHSAVPFRRSSLVGPTSGIDSIAMHEMLIGENKVPSILWLERLVAHSLQQYVERPRATAKGSPS